MTYKLHMNGVITGSLNSFCLACDVFLKSQQEAFDHIGTSEHKMKSDAVQYCDKFQHEHIKKFKAGYYCEFCNILMPIACKVNLHITEAEHKHNKGILLLKPLGGDVVAFNNVVIEEKVWHGLIDGVCSLCNAEFEDETSHKTNTSHSLNLVLKPIQFGADNAIFRHLDNTAVQCLTCNKLLAPARMIKHFDDTEHHELYAKRRIETNGGYQKIDTKENCQEIDTIPNCQEKVTNMALAILAINDGEMKKVKIDNYFTNNSNEKSPTKNKSKILESISRYQSNGININFETETAFCRKCSNVVTFDIMAIENHIDNHSTATVINSDLLYPSNLDQNLTRFDVDINYKTIQSCDYKQHTEVVNDITKSLQDNFQNAASNAASREENNDTESSALFIPPHDIYERFTQDEAAKNFAKANHINYKGDVMKSFCRICVVHVPACMKSLKEHVGGANHKRLVASAMTQPKTVMQPPPRELVRLSTREFVDSAYDVRAMFYIVSIINEEFCILRNSLLLISENISGIRCYACGINLPPFSDIVHHVKTLQHQLKWQGVPVITSERWELIREVCPGLFHCGYCNFVVSSWVDLKQHLECSDHRVSRSVGESRLRQHMPALQRHKMQKALESRT